jgi:hypothetical protein
MALRHAAAGFMGAERGFNRVRGYKHMGVLLAMLEINTGDQTVRQNSMIYSYRELFGSILRITNSTELGTPSFF